MKKYMDKDGRVAVLYSPCYGAGWSTWNSSYPELIFDPKIVEFVLNDQRDQIHEYLNENYDDVYFSDLLVLEVAWIEPGRKFQIKEYDGYESIVFKDQQKWFTA